MTYLTTTGPRVGPRAIGCAALLALVLCSALTSAASASIGPLTRYSVSSATDSSAIKTVTAYCPARTHVLATGARITNGGEVLLEDVAPTPTPTLTGATATAHEDADGWNANWYVTATAICGNASGLQLVSNSQPSGVWSDLAVSVYCPAGKQYLSYGLAASGPLEHGTSIGTMELRASPTGRISRSTIGPAGPSRLAGTRSAPIPFRDGSWSARSARPTRHRAAAKSEALLPLPWVDRSSV